MGAGDGEGDYSDDDERTGTHEPVQGNGRERPGDGQFVAATVDGGFGSVAARAAEQQEIEKMADDGEGKGGGRADDGIIDVEREMPSKGGGQEHDSVENHGANEPADMHGPEDVQQGGDVDAAKNEVERHNGDGNAEELPFGGNPAGFGLGGWVRGRSTGAHIRFKIPAGRRNHNQGFYLSAGFTICDLRANRIFGMVVCDSGGIDYL